VYEKGAYIRNTSIKNGTQLVIYWCIKDVKQMYYCLHLLFW
jgi:hypothetical protein